MRPLKSHVRDDALTTLETLLKQTKEARGFRRAQAVREVVAGRHVNAVSENGFSALPRRGPKACTIVRALADRTKSPVNWKDTSIASSSKSRSSMARSPRSGAVANSHSCWPNTPGCKLGAKVSAVH